MTSAIAMIPDRHADKAYPLAPGDALFFDAAALHGPEEPTKLPMTYLSNIIYLRTDEPLG